MLTALASAGYPLAILATAGNGMPRLLEPILPPGAFEVVLVEDDVVDASDRSRRLIAAGERLEIDSGQIALIASSAASLSAGRAVGMPTGAALWSLPDPLAREGFLARSGEHAPKWVFEAPADVTRQFARWC